MALCLGAGCSTLRNSDSAPAPAKPSKSAPVGTYEEFEDVLIPKEMSLVGKASFIFETPQFKTGILTYEGRVDAVSLSNFFEANMVQDNWKLRSKMKYTRTILVFEKPNRDCIINILDATFKTSCEVMVAPRMEPDRTATPASARFPAAMPLEENLAQ
jgi:hypothetical protein